MSTSLVESFFTEIAELDPGYLFTYAAGERETP